MMAAQSARPLSSAAVAQACMCPHPRHGPRATSSACIDAPGAGRDWRGPVGGVGRGAHAQGGAAAGSGSSSRASRRRAAELASAARHAARLNAFVYATAAVVMARVCVVLMQVGLHVTANGLPTSMLFCFFLVCFFDKQQETTHAAPPQKQRLPTWHHSPTTRCLQPRSDTRATPSASGHS